MAKSRKFGSGFPGRSVRSRETGTFDKYNFGDDIDVDSHHFIQFNRPIELAGVILEEHAKARCLIAGIPVNHGEEEKLGRRR